MKQVVVVQQKSLIATLREALSELNASHLQNHQQSPERNRRMFDNRTFTTPPDVSELRAATQTDTIEALQQNDHYRPPSDPILDAVHKTMKHQEAKGYSS